MKRIPVIFNHSAAIDDFVSTALLTTMPHIDLKGVIVTDADCITDQGMQMTWKVHQFLKITHLVPGLSDARGWNPFPYLYRADCERMRRIGVLKNLKDNPSWPPYPSGEALFRNLLENCIKNNEPAIVLVTGPFTTLANLLSKDPDLKKGISEIVWMGGAINVKGNLMPKTVPEVIRNRHAEWNAFWDPFAVETMLSMATDIRIFPLDITNQARLKKSFLAELKTQSRKYQLSRFVSQAYKLVEQEKDYEMWNTLATAYLSRETNLFEEPENMML
ncbi:MAG TPA: nucleoside hydrolase, partial [Chitinophagaceae bacterium]|nr:nucleoside hydrolase [Chitinophagaceae bacterium]